MNMCYHIILLILQQLTDADNRFDGKILLEKVPNLGIIIDLTNTNRYYDPRVSFTLFEILQFIFILICALLFLLKQCFENEGVRHQKLMIPGHVTPPQRLVDKYVRLISFKD